MFIDMSFKFLEECFFFFFNELSHENLFVFICSGWIYLLCEANEGEEIK